MSYFRPTTPDEAHERTYMRVIARIADDVDYTVWTELISAPLTFLEPLDLTTHPTTFGPEDEDPFYLLRQEAKKIDPRSFIGAITTTKESQEMLKAALAATRRAESATILERIGKTVEPPFDFSKTMFGPMTARSIRELQKLKERLTPPRSVKQLFLPSSRYFTCGYASVPRIVVPPVTPLDAIDATLKLGELGPAIKNVISKASHVPSNTLEKVWARWSELDKDIIDWRALKIPAPIFPTRANEPPIITYEYTSQLVACSTPLDGAARGERPTPSMFLAVFEETRDIDPYSSFVLDEFDDVQFLELSATTRASSNPTGRSEPRRSTSSRFISSRSCEPIKAWKHTSAFSYSSPDPYSEATSVSTSDYYSSKRTSVGKSESYYWHGQGALVPKHPALTVSYQHAQHEYWGDCDGDDEMLDDLGAFDYEPSSDIGSSTAVQRVERASTQPYSRAQLAELAQPWASTSRNYPQSPTSLGSAVPLGHDFARYDIDWTAPLQTSDASRQLASPIKIRDPPTPNSNANVSDPEPPLPRSDWMGPSKRLTYGEPEAHWQPSFWLTQP